MKKLTKYNGYTNYWTWKIKLDYFDDFEPFYDWIDLDGDNEDLEIDLRGYVIEQIEHHLFKTDAKVWSIMEMIETTLDFVNWVELRELLEREAIAAAGAANFKQDENVH